MSTSASPAFDTDTLRRDIVQGDRASYVESCQYGWRPGPRGVHGLAAGRQDRRADTDPGMGRIGGRAARFQVGSRLTWPFSARAGLGRSRSTRSRLPGPASAVSHLVSAALVRSLMRAARPRPGRTAVRGLRSRRAVSVRVRRGRDWR